MNSKLNCSELSYTEPVIDSEHLTVNVLAILGTPASGTELRSLFDNPNTEKIEIHIGDPVHISETEGPFPKRDVLILDVGENGGIGIDDLSGFISKYHANRRVIVTTDEVDLAVIRRMMDAGAVDVLSRPIRKTDLAVALDHATRREQISRGNNKEEGKIIAFMKASGGVGATTLATQGAALLAQGTKQNRPKVCLVDFDIQFGQVGLQLDAQDTVGLQDLINASSRLDATLIESVMGHHRCGLDYLIAPKEILALEMVSPEFVGTLLGLLKETYDFVIIDLPQTWTGWLCTALHEADTIILVAQLSVVSIAQAVKQLETLSDEGIDGANVVPVINRYEKKFSLSGDPYLGDAEKALRTKLKYFIPSDYQLVNEATNQGTLISSVRRKSKIEKSLVRLFDEVRERLVVDDRRVVSR